MTFEVRAIHGLGNQEYSNSWSAVFLSKVEKVVFIVLVFYGIDLLLLYWRIHRLHDTLIMSMVRKTIDEELSSK